MHGNICDAHQVHDIDELKQRVTDDAMDEWHKHLWMCIHAK